MECLSSLSVRSAGGIKDSDQSWLPTKMVKKTLVKHFNHTPRPEGYTEVSFSWWDFANDDPAWKMEHDTLDQEQKARKREVYEKIAEQWNSEFAEEHRKKIIERIIHLWKVEKQSTQVIATNLKMQNKEVCEILVAEKVAVWMPNPKESEKRQKL